jgi:hypothetical protein
MKTLLLSRPLSLFSFLSSSGLSSVSPVLSSSLALFLSWSSSQLFALFSWLLLRLSSWLPSFLCLRISLSFFSLIKSIFIFFLLFYSPFSYSQSSECLMDDFSNQEVGYQMNNQRIQNLTRNLWLKSSLALEKEEILRRIESYMEKHNPEAEKKLSPIILRASKATLIDPFIFTSLIKSESTFNPQAKSRTGALGLTQMTTIAFSELRNQLGVGDPTFNARARDYFVAMIEAFFQNKALAEDYIRFVESTKNSSQMSLLTKNVRYSLLSGALLLKINLALSGGNYRRALEAYNGSHDKVPYASRILDSSQKGFQPVSLRCMNTKYSTPIVADTCEITGDSQFCQKYLGLISL